MKGRTIRIEEVENGYTVNIRTPVKNSDNGVYCDDVCKEYIAESKEKVSELVSSFIGEVSQGTEDSTLIGSGPAPIGGNGTV